MRWLHMHACCFELCTLEARSVLGVGLSASPCRELRPGYCGPSPAPQFETPLHLPNVAPPPRSCGSCTRQSDSNRMAVVSVSETAPRDPEILQIRIKNLLWQVGGWTRSALASSPRHTDRGSDS